MTLVRFSRARRRPDPVRVQEFAATARKLQSERDAAAALVARAVRDTPRAQWPSLGASPEIRTIGALESLGREVRALLDESPRDALALADVATSIADTLAADEYPPIVVAQTRAHAWKDRAQALSCLARHDDALAAISRADALLGSFGTLGHDQAIIGFVRASILQEVNRYEDSLQLLNECCRVFRAHGDARRCLLCGIAEGVLLHRMQRFREARDVFVPLLAVAEELNDREYAASIHNNAAYSCIEFGDFVAAQRHLDEAAATFRELHQPVRVALAELARGRMLARRGDTDTAIAHLRRVRADLLGRGVVEEAGVCGLEIVETLLLADRCIEAESLARDVIREFNAARLNARAITALGYLQEAIAGRTATAATVEHVRRYIGSLRRNPHREFAAAV